jgi:hypothetical protein
MTNLNLKRRGAPGSGCQASTFGKDEKAPTVGNSLGTP